MGKKTYIIISVDTEADIFKGRIIPISKIVVQTNYTFILITTKQLHKV